MSPQRLLGVGRLYPGATFSLNSPTQGVADVHTMVSLKDFTEVVKLVLQNVNLLSYLCLYACVSGRDRERQKQKETEEETDRYIS